jgi:hypothetical protein
MKVSLRIHTDMPRPITELDTIGKIALGLLAIKGIKIITERLERSSIN